MIPAKTHKLTLPVAMIERGFWLYVWRIRSPVGELLYVGRTGDSSSSRASTPFARMGQHLGTNANQNMVRKHLEKRNTQPEECTSIELIAYGPLFPEALDWRQHESRRDIVAALEKVLADTLAFGGYDVLNQVRSKHPVDVVLWAAVRQAFAAHFPHLAEVSPE